MKIKCFLIAKIFIFLFFSCSVNETTGLIRVTNKTAVTLTNLRIGEKIILYRLDPFSQYDYWFFNEIAGELSSESIDTKSSQRNLEFILKQGYWVEITASVNNISNKEELSIYAEKHSSNDLTYSDWIED